MNALNTAAALLVTGETLVGDWYALITVGRGVGTIHGEAPRTVDFADAYDAAVWFIGMCGEDAVIENAERLGR